MPKVSVIVPVYNVEKYLAKCLDSIVNQSFKDLEILIVNDGSQDNSQSIIDEYVKKYDFVKSYKKKNGGLSDARNYAIKRACGQYIALVDSDDYIDKDFVGKLYTKAIENDLDLVVCDTVFVYEGGHEQISKSNLHFSDNNLKNYLLAPPTGCIRLYKRELFKNNLFKKGILYEDLEFTPRLVKKTKKIGFVEEGLYYYLQRPGSIMKQADFNFKLLDIFEVLKVNQKALKNEYPLELEYLYITHLLRTTTLRFLDYKNTDKYLKQINDIMREDFPKWESNIYYKKSSFKLKLVCFLAFHEHYNILKLIKKLHK